MIAVLRMGAVDSIPGVPTCRDSLLPSTYGDQMCSSIGEPVSIWWPLRTSIIHGKMERPKQPKNHCGHSNKKVIPLPPKVEKDRFDSLESRLARNIVPERLSNSIRTAPVRKVEQLSYLNNKGEEVRPRAGGSRRRDV